MIKTFRRLADLFEDPECTIDRISLQSFLNFMMKCYDEINEPSITVTDNGNIKATWHENNDHIFWIEFKTLTFGKYLIFMGNYRKSREETIEFIEKFMKQAKWVYKGYKKDYIDIDKTEVGDISHLFKALEI